MSATLATALLLQLSAVILLRHRLGKTWLRRPVTLLVLASVVYQGVSPVLMAFPSIGRWDIYRQGVAQQYIDQATLIMSAGMLALTVCYLLTRPERVMAVPEPGDVRQAARVLDWRLLALACAPLAVLTYEGRGYNNGIADAAAKTVSSNLAGTFLVLLTVLTAFAFLLRRGSRWFLPVLAIQSLVLAAAGERTPVLSDGIALAVMLAAAGIRPSRRQAAGALALTCMAILAITGLRAQQGRSVFYADTGLTARLSALGNGVLAIGGSQPGHDGPDLTAQAATRLDGTDFAGAVLQAEHLGDPRLAAACVPESLLIAVPSAVWTSKLAHGPCLNPALTEIDNLGLQRVNFLPCLGGLYFGFLSPAWLIVLLALLGLAAGYGERWLMRRITAPRLVLLAGSVIAAMWYPAGLPAMTVALRAAVAIALLAAVPSRVRMPAMARITGST